MARLVSSNRDNSKVERTISLPDFLKDLTVCRVSRIEYFLAPWSLNHKTSPKTSILLE